MRFVLLGVGLVAVAMIGHAAGRAASDSMDLAVKAVEVGAPKSSVRLVD